MPLSYNEFVKGLDEKLSKLKNGEQISGMTACKVCSIPLQETVTGCRIINGDHVCSDCYFDAFGDELDAHPIRMPRHAHAHNGV